MCEPSIPPMTATPIVCDMTDAPDTAQERLAEWGRLFAAAYAGRERTGEGTRWRFHDHDGVAEWVRDLAAREKVCCPFLDFTVTTAAGEIRWDATVADDGVADDLAHMILDELYALPDVVGDGVAGLESRLDGRGPGFSVQTYLVR